MSGAGGPFEGDGRTVVRPSAPDPTRIATGPLPPQGGPAPGVPSPDATLFFSGGPVGEPGRAGAEATVFAPASPDLQAAPAGWDEADRFGARRVEAGSLEDRFRFPGQNPLLAAAAPTLALLGRIEAGSEAAGPDIIGRLADAAVRFEARAQKAGVGRQNARIAQYALCATADELGGRLPGAERERWLRDGLLTAVFKARNGATGFFEALNKVVGEPAPDPDLLELLHACLALGFEGQYRGMAGGAAALARVRADVFSALARVRPQPGGTVLSPHLEDLAAPAGPGARVSVWAAGAGALALLAGVFLALRVLLTAQGEALAAALLALSPAGPVSIERAAVAAAPQQQNPAQPPVAPQVASEAAPVSDAQLSRLRTALAAEIGTGGVSIVARGDAVVVEISNALLFDAGSAALKPGFEPAAARLAAALDKEKGPLAVVGHTDTVKPRRTSAFKSNFDLSLARAEAVKSRLAAGIADKARLSAAGKGEDEPVADNKTAEGRAANRRIELILRREAAP